MKTVIGRPPKSDPTGVLIARLRYPVAVIPILTNEEKFGHCARSDTFEEPFSGLKQRFKDWSFDGAMFFRVCKSAVYFDCTMPIFAEHIRRLWSFSTICNTI